jgi:Zn-dependent protease with chaperone function
MPTEFRHPIDTRSTQALQQFFPLEFMIRQGSAGVVEQFMFLDNLSSGVRVGPNQLPRIYAALQEAKQVLGLDIAVDLYVKQNPVPNAYTMAMQGKKPFIVVHSSLIDLMSPDELQAVIAHELGHLKCEHGVWITAANIITNVASQIPFTGQLIAQSMQMSLMRWLQAAELSCDRASLLVVQDPRVVVSVIMKLTGGAASFADELNPDAFLRQAREFEEESSNSWIGRQLRQANAQTLTHPLPVVRVGELDKWSRSDEYRQLISKGRPLVPDTPSTAQK